VVVAVEGEATRELMCELLSGAGFDVTAVATGREVVAHVIQHRPWLVLVDVSLTDLPGAQVCEAIRREPGRAEIKIMLVAAIYRKDRYRRDPGNLFGADGFIERHQIEGELLNKVTALRSGGSATDQATPQLASPVESEAPTPTPPESPRLADPPALPKPPAPPPARPSAPAAVSQPPVLTAVPSTPIPAVPVPVVAKPADPAQEAALRLARIIVSDIALYNAKKVDEGVLKGTFFDVLRQEIEEGRRLFEERLPPELASGADLFQQTLEQFVATRKQLLQRNNPAAA
jgi:CheY-like chemotaxis protein